MLGSTFSSSHSFEIGIFSIKCRRRTLVFSSALQLRRSFFIASLPVLPSARHSFVFSPKLNFQLNRHKVNRLLAELGTSHTSFFHKTTPVPSRNSINAT